MWRHAPTLLTRRHKSDDRNFNTDRSYSIISRRLQCCS
jgi:hypothetical protein